MLHDNCGICNGDNNCEDCAGVPNGNAYVDECGVCDADPSNDCVQDCFGEWGGDAELDECGVCEGDGVSVWCEDADGDGLGAGQSIESCDAPPGWVDNCTDPEPNCESNDTDECGVCGGDGIADGACDCDGSGLDCLGDCAMPLI